MQSLQDELEEIKEIEFEQPNEALQRYSALMEADMEEKGEVFYRFGCFLHAFAEEEMALELLVQAHGEHVRRKEIMELLLQDFWEPNKEEFRKAYLSQAQELRKEREELAIPDFDALPYRMFPVSDNRIMVYNKRKECFLGWLDSGVELGRKRWKETDAFFPVILDMESGSLQDLLYYFYQNNERTIYVLEREAEWIGLLMLPNIRKDMPSVIPLQGLEDAKAYFRESMCRLPEIVRVRKKHMSEVKNCLSKEHERRIREMGNERPKPLLTIGIPSWNRGNRAKGLVEELCKLPYDVDLEILVSNNGSDKTVEEYHAIRDMQDARVSYMEFEENKMYYGNIAQVCRKASGSWVLLLSDEDAVDAKLLQGYMEKLEQFRENVSVIRPGSTGQYLGLQEKYAKAGEDAIAAYGLRNNYVSGVTYNRKFMTNELVDKIEKAWIGNYAYQIYAHMVFDWYMCLKGDVRLDPIRLVVEGEAEDGGSGEQEALVFEYNKYENRIRQFDAYLEIINGMDEADDAEKAVLFIAVCTKTIILLCMLRNIYEKELGSWEVCEREVLDKIEKGYGNLNVRPENRRRYMGDVMGNIQNAINQFGF